MASKKKITKSLEKFSKVYRRKNIVDAEDGPKLIASSASYAEAHPAPCVVDPSRDAIDEIADDVFHTRAVARFDREQNKIALDVIASPNTTHFHPADAPRAVGFSLADVAASAMRTGRRQ